MTLRSLLYLAESFREFILNTEQNYYSSKTVSIPRPELYVLYTGDDHGEEIMSMSKTFWGGDDSAVDVKVRILYGEGTDTILSQYSEFTRTYKRYKALYGPTRETVEKTIDKCIEKGVLVDYLTERRVEVMDMMTALFDPDTVQEMYEKSIRREAREEELLKLYKAGDISEETAMKNMKCSREELERILENS